MDKRLQLDLDRSATLSLTEQIRIGISAAIENGVLAPGARLPSWQDLASQLGVARGTVRIAYEKLSAAQLIEASRSAGTHVAQRPRPAARSDQPFDAGSFMETYQEMTRGPAIFQMGVPASESFPATLFARIRAHAVRAEAGAPPMYPDPRGEPELRQEIAGYLAVARGLECSPSQIIITAGYAGGLGLALRVLGLEGETAWMEEPGFPFTRRGLALGRLLTMPVPVDADGIDVGYGLRHAPHAKLVVVTPGQQAPLGGTLSLARRIRLLDWATEQRAWVIEDDYLSELQLRGRAAPALASLDRAERVIHVGSFSKTMSPTLRLGFLVAPPSLLPRFIEVAACLGPPPGPSTQLAVAQFMREGHYLRHLRRLKRTYSAQQDALLKCLRAQEVGADLVAAGLAVLVRFSGKMPDIAIAREAAAFGMAPVPLSAWYGSEGTHETGLLLGSATAPKRYLEVSCRRLLDIIQRSR